MTKHSIILFILTGVFAGFLLTTQFNSDMVFKSRFPTDDAAARAALLEEYLKEQSYLKSRVVTLREKINEEQAGVENQSEDSNVELLEALKTKVGLSPMSGKGVEVLLDDSPIAHRESADITDLDLVQAGDIRDIINLLRAGGAEAISLNNQRVIASSTVTSVGTTLLVNNFHIAPPFNIKAIGDTGILLQRLQSKRLIPSLYEREKNGNIVFELFVKNTINIPIYGGDLKANYLNLVKQSEE